MGTRSRWGSIGLRCAAASVAGLLWCAPAAQAAPTLAIATSSGTLTSASWRVVITTATAPPYAAGPPATVNGALLGPQYFTVANIGTRQPSTVTYRLTNAPGLAINAAMCATRWSSFGACPSGSTAVTFNTAAASALVPAVGDVLYLQVTVLVAGAGTLQAEAARPAVPSPVVPVNQ